MSEPADTTHNALIEVLRQIADAAMNPSSAPSSFDSYEKRSGKARIVGEELHRRGGTALMRKALQQDLGWMPGSRTIEQYWDGIGDWRG